MTLLRLEIAAAALILAACAAFPQQADPGTRTVTNKVMVPVPKPCLTADIPQPPTATRVNIDKAATDQLAAATAADAEAFEAYSKAASQLLALCVQSVQTPKVTTQPLKGKQ